MIINKGTHIGPTLYCAKNKSNRFLLGSVARHQRNVWFYLAAQKKYPLSSNFINRLKRDGYRVVKAFLLESSKLGDIC